MMPRIHHPSRTASDVPRVLGIRADAVTMADALARTESWIAQHHSTPEQTAQQIVTLNPEIVMAARRDPDLRALIAAAALVVPDGIGVVWAARRLGWPLPERVTGVDLLAALAERAATRGWRLFLLGGGPGIAAAAADALRARHPTLLVAGSSVATPDPAADAWTAGQVRARGADVVCVAFGAPAQELWIARNRERLGVGVALGVGGALDMLAGRVPRAPLWLRRAGLEWVYRLWREPWRWRRMLALPRFAGAVLLARWLPSGAAAGSGADHIPPN